VDKGSIYISAIGGWHNSEYFGFSFFLIPRFEYLIKNKFSIGSDIGYMHDWAYNSIIINPFARYYLLNKKLSPIIEVSYFHQFKFENNIKARELVDTNILYLNIGISTPRLIFNRLGFDLTSGFYINYYGNNYFDARFSPLTSLRITYSIKNK